MRVVNFVFLWTNITPEILGFVAKEGALLYIMGDTGFMENFGDLIDMISLFIDIIHGHCKAVNRNESGFPLELGQDNV